MLNFWMKKRNKMKTDKLRIELWKSDELSVPWPKAIYEPTGSVYIPPWDEKLIDLEFMQKYIGQEIEVWIQISMVPKELQPDKKLIRVEKVNGLWEFETI